MQNSIPRYHYHRIIFVGGHRKRERQIKPQHNTIHTIIGERRRQGATSSRTGKRIKPVKVNHTLCSAGKPIFTHATFHIHHGWLKSKAQSAIPKRLRYQTIPTTSVQFCPMDAGFRTGIKLTFIATPPLLVAKKNVNKSRAAGRQHRMESHLLRDIFAILFAMCFLSPVLCLPANSAQWGELSEKLIKHKYCNTFSL